MISETKRTRRATLAVTAFSGLLAFGTPALAIDDEALIALGESEYLGSCASCHGADARGAGPVAEVLTARPTDLTQLTAQFNGIFPVDHVYRVIDGRTMINPHGDRMMPVWGARLFISGTERANEVPHDVDVQALVHGRISALVTFIESIQAE